MLCLDCVISIEQAVYDSADMGAVVAPDSRNFTVQGLGFWVLD